ncbi:MAG: hypothetical protein R2799_13840 [Crocinitomicaceae bacterium]
MKKIIGICLVATGLVATSCNKTYVCDYGSGVTQEYSSKTYTSTQIDLLETACTAAGGTWSTK